jgi:hypothetical protein
MISGRANLKQAGLLLALCGPLAAAPVTPAWTLAELLHTLASRGDSRANFVEIRTLALLNQPLRLEGSVEFRPPGYLAKHVRLPAEEHYIIDGNALRIERPGQAPLQVEGVRRVTLTGSGDHIKRLDIEEAGGDHSSLRFQPQP